ncbi:MAG: VOC family protein [Proteobacteria bacterium]|nr:VOC family protein [Pseudomonadota bacterium]
MPAITGIDHLLIDVEDLEGARATWHRLGFTMTPRGLHPQWGTGNYCMMFADSYLELIGIADPQVYAQNEARRGRRRTGTGLSAIALATGDAQAAKAALAGAGIVADGPKDLSRLLEAQEGTREPRFHILHLPAGASPAIPMFLCRHLSPDLVRRPEWLAHDNGATAIVSLAVPVDDPGATDEAYRRLFGHGAVTRTDETLTLRIGGTSVLLVRPEDYDSLFPDLHEEGQTPPGVVTLRVADVEATARHLAAVKVPFRREPRAVTVAPKDACGVAVVFAA